MKVTVYTAKSKLVDSNDMDSVYLPTLDGDLTILDNHNPIIGVLREGTAILRKSSKEEISISLDMGYFEFSDNELTVLIENTRLTEEELKVLQEKAVKAKKTNIGEEDKISEDDFEERKESEGF